MATQPSIKKLTPEQYLAAERIAEHKSEYLRGEMFAMAGANRYHNRISVNLSRELSLRLQGSGCNVYGPDLRVAVSPVGLYTYPDLVVTCGDEHFLDEQVDTLLNPLFIVEILSQSTKNYDRGEKFQSYRTIASFREYWTVAQDALHIECWSRAREDVWTLHEHHAASLERSRDIRVASSALPEFEIPMFSIYENALPPTGSA